MGCQQSSTEYNCDSPPKRGEYSYLALPIPSWLVLFCLMFWSFFLDRFTVNFSGWQRKSMRTVWNSHTWLKKSYGHTVMQRENVFVSSADSNQISCLTTGRKLWTGRTGITQNRLYTDISTGKHTVMQRENVFVSPADSKSNFLFDHRKKALNGKNALNGNYTPAFHR